MIHVSVVLPTYNERDNICDLVDALCAVLAPTGYRYEILVVDDSSPDGTAEAARRRYRLEGSSGALPKHPLGSLRLFVRTRATRGAPCASRDGLILAQGQKGAGGDGH